MCEVRVPSGWTRPTKSAWRCGCSLPLTTVAKTVDNPGVLDRCEREFCLLKGIAEGTYNSKHAEAAKLYYTTI